MFLITFIVSGVIILVFNLTNYFDCLILLSDAMAQHTVSRFYLILNLTFRNDPFPFLTTVKRYCNFELLSIELTLSGNDIDLKTASAYKLRLQ